MRVVKFPTIRILPLHNFEEKKLQALLNHPAVQSVLAPFVVALITAELLQRLRLSGLAIIAGFIATVYLVSDLSLSPFTTTRKIIWLGIASSLVGVGLGFLNWSLWRPVLTVTAGAAAIWIGLRVLQQQPLGIAMQWGIGGALYLGWIVFWMDDLHGDSMRAGSAGMALGLGSGAAVLFGGSALLGQFGLSLGAAAGAYLLIQMISNSRLPCGRSYTLPLSLICGLTASFAVLTTQLPWYALLPLAAIPLAVKIPVTEKRALWVQSLLLTLATLACAAGAVYLTWRVAGAPSL